MEKFYQNLLEEAEKLDKTYYAERAIEQFKKGCVHYFIGGIENGREVTRDEVVNLVGGEEVLNRWEKFILQETALNFSYTFEFQSYNFHGELIGIHIVGV